MPVPYALACVMALLSAVYIVANIRWALSSTRPQLRYIARRLWNPGEIQAADPEVHDIATAMLHSRRIHCSKIVSFVVWTILLLVAALSIMDVCLGVEGLLQTLAIKTSLFATFTILHMLPEVYRCTCSLPIIHVIASAKLLWVDMAESEDSLGHGSGSAFAFGSLIFGGLCLRWHVLVVSNVIVTALIVGREFMRAEAAYGPDFTAMARSEVFLLLTKLSLFYAAEFAAEFSARHEVQVRFGKRQQSAVLALLGMMCDAVVDLDNDTRMKEHFPKLGAMLMHGPGRPLAGVLLSDLVQQGEDRAKVEELMQVSGEQEEGSPGPSMIAVGMRDAIGNLLRIVLYHVPYITTQGHTHHYVGIREEVDSSESAAKPLQRTVVVERGRRIAVTAGGHRRHSSSKLESDRGNFEATAQHMRRLGSAASSSRNHSDSGSTFGFSGLEEGSDSSSEHPVKGSHPFGFPSLCESASAYANMTFAHLGKDGPDAEMIFSALLRPGLPIRSGGHGVLGDLGMPTVPRRFGDLLPDDGLGLTQWIRDTAERARLSGSSGNFSACFGEVELAHRGASSPAKTLRKLWVYFPAPLPGACDLPSARYAVSIGLSRGDADATAKPPLVNVVPTAESGNVSLWGL